MDNAQSRRATKKMIIPSSIESEAQLEDVLSEPSPVLVRDIVSWKSPLLILGANGKMGPTLALMAKKAAARANHPLRIIAVSRFSPAPSAWWKLHEIETISADLLEQKSFENLPDSPNVLYLVGLKFGTSSHPWRTWAVNCLVPAFTAQRFSRSAVVALSTGNVYPYTKPESGGAVEETPLQPISEYGWAAVGRERIFQHASERWQVPVVLLRLNYAVELRYGVLVDIASRIYKNEPIDLAMGYLNCIWQRDANEAVLRSRALCASPAAAYNLTGLETFSVRELANKIALALKKEVRFSGTELGDALLNNAARLHKELRLVTTPAVEAIPAIADWMRRSMPLLGKPSHFQSRQGQF